MLNLILNSSLVLAMAYGVEKTSMTFAGMVGIMDPPREGARQAVQMLLGMGVKVKMLTGDSEDTAKAVGKLQI